jgi:hypothetical protein
MKPETASKLLSWMLIVIGVAAMTAVVPMVMPTDWMEIVNDRMGLGPFPRSTLTEYLTRSLSGLYAMIGGMMFYLGLHVRRHVGVIGVLGWLMAGFGVALTGIDFAIGMPANWAWGEGPPTVVIGLVFVGLARRSRRAHSK